MAQRLPGGCCRSSHPRLRPRSLPGTPPWTSAPKTDAADKQDLGPFFANHGRFSGLPLAGDLQASEKSLDGMEFNLDPAYQAKGQTQYQLSSFSAMISHLALRCIRLFSKGGLSAFIAPWHSMAFIALQSLGWRTRQNIFTLVVAVSLHRLKPDGLFVHQASNDTGHIRKANKPLTTLTNEEKAVHCIICLGKRPGKVFPGFIDIESAAQLYHEAKLRRSNTLAPSVKCWITAAARILRRWLFESRLLRECFIQTVQPAQNTLRNFAFHIDPAFSGHIGWDIASVCNHRFPRYKAVGDTLPYNFLKNFLK